MRACFSKLRTLVVGGGGFIGSRVVALLAERGSREITVLGRSASPKQVLPIDVRYIKGDVGDRELLKGLLGNCDEVIDLSYGTVPKTSYEDPVRDVLLNLPPSVGLIEIAAQCELKRFVLISSGGTVYGPAKNIPIEEGHSTNPISPYGITKLAIEKYALMYQQLKGLPAIILRPGNPFGPTQNSSRGQGFIATAIEAILHKKPVTIFGSGTVRDYLYIDDLASGVIAALDSADVGEIYNIGSGYGVDNLQIIDRLERIVRADGYQIKVERLPPRGFDVLSNVLDATKLSTISGWIPQYDFDAALKLTWDEMRSRI